MDSEKMVWRQIPKNPTQEELNRPPFSGSMVLLKTEKGACQGVKIRPGPNGWKRPGVDNLLVEATYWAEVPKNPYADPATWDARPKPLLENEKSYLIFLSSLDWLEGATQMPTGWVEAKCYLYKTRPPRWQFAWDKRKHDIHVRYWLDLPISMETVATTWRDSLISKATEPWV